MTNAPLVRRGVLYSAGFIELSGVIRFPLGLYMNVDKLLEVVRGRGATALVQTVYYSYNAAIERVGNVFRYDSPHPDHNQFHHVHRYDVFRGDSDGTVEEYQPAGDWPILGEVIQELQQFLFDNISRLGVVRAGLPPRAMD